MMKKSKRVLCALLGALVAVASVGCAQQQSGSSSQPGNSSSESSQTNSTSEQGGTISVGMPSGWVSWGGVDELFKKYESEKGIKVEVQAVEDDQFDNLLMSRMATGEGWDVFFRYTGTQASKYTNLADLSNEAWVSRIAESGKPYIYRDGKVVCAPFGGASSLCYLYNKKVFSDNNIQVPQTVEEFEAACETLKNNGVIPIFMGSAGGAGWMAIQLMNAGWGNTATADGANVTDTVNKLNKNETKWSEIPAFKEYLSIWQRWGEKGYFNPNMASDDTATGVQLVGEGKCAMIITGDWQWSEFNEKYPDVEIGGMPGPALNGKNVLAVNGPNGIYVSSTSNNQDAAKKLVAWLCEKDQLEFQYEKKAEMSVWTDVTPKKLNPVLEGFQTYMNENRTVPHWGQFYVIPYAEDQSTMIFQVISGQKTADEMADQWSTYMINQGKQMGFAGF